MKALTLFAITLVVYGISLSLFIPGFSMGNAGAIVANVNYVANALISISLFICLLLVDWRKKTEAKEIGEVTGSWLDATAFTAVIIFTVITPAVTILFEAITHTCADGMFDMIPTPLHFMLLALGPVLNGFCAGLLFQKVDIEPKTVNFLNGLALGIALPFAIATLPLLVLGLLALFSGVVWMIFSALLAFISTIKLFDLLTLFYSNLKVHGRLRMYGLITGLILFILVQTPIWMTHFMTNLAAKDPNNKMPLQMIKLFGDKKFLLQKCYLSTNRASINEVGLPVMSTTDAQNVFKQVTKKDYTSFPKPPVVERFEARFRD